MRILKTISEALGSNNAPGSEQANIFPEIDLDFVRKDSNPRTKGSEDGTVNFPATLSAQQTATEQAIKATFEQYQQRYITDYNRQQSSYRSRIESIIQIWKVDAVENEERLLVNNVIAQAKEDADPIFKKRELLRAASNELLTFRETHDLKHRLPRIQDAFTALNILFGFFILELVLTTFLIRESGGLIDVIVTASIYCLINCLFPFFAGKFVRDINYIRGVNDLWKSIGFLALVFLVALGTLLNLGMGHYRAVTLEIGERVSQINTENITLDQFADIAQATTQIGVRAVDRLTDNWFFIGDTYSYLLFILGLICFFISLYEGIIKDDPYPKYGEKSTNFQDLYEDFSDTKDEIIEALKVSREGGVKEIDKLKKGLVTSIERIPSISARSVALKASCESAILLLNTRYIQLIAEYRDANRIARSDPAPDYFDSEVSLPEVNLQDPIVREIPDNVRNPLLSRVNDFSNKLHSEFEKIIAEVESAEKVLDRWPLEVKKLRS
ncbi:hypothetical protein OAB62_02915 [Pseudomonadales bacterium]|nr:hypothetical protein [Pseudomonadales bacterium]